MSDLHRPKRIHRTLVWGGWYGSRNIGDTAILLGIKEMYKQINQGRHYYLGYLSTDVDYTNTNGVSGKFALVKSDILKPWNWIKLVNTFREADRIIISGGTPIFDFSHMIRSLYFFLPLILKKPFILFGAGVKPIKKAYGRWYIPLVLNKANYLSARDDNSTKILKELGIKNVIKTADSAFFAQPCNDEELARVLKRYGIKQKEKLLVVAPRLMSPDKKRLYLDEDMDVDIVKQTPEKIADTINNVSAQYDKVVFMAMHYYGPDSDVKLIHEIASMTKRATIIEEELRPEVAIGLFKHAHVVFAMRLHALLLSASMYTPIVGIAYEQKVKDLFKRLGIEENVLDLFNLSVDEMTKTLTRTAKSRDTIHKKLEKRVTELRQLVLKDAKKVLSIDSTYAD